MVGIIVGMNYIFVTACPRLGDIRNFGGMRIELFFGYFKRLEIFYEVRFNPKTLVKLLLLGQLLKI